MSVPKLRFPEFDGEWEEKKLVELTSGGMYGLNAAAKDFDGVNKYIRITDINETSNNFVPNPLCSPEGDLDEKFLLKEDDLVFARTGASTGKSYLYKKSDGKLFFAGFLIKFHINKANSRFVFYNTLRTQYNNWVKIMSVRSGQPGINAEEYKKLELKVPSIQEQQKVAVFLSKVDEKIEKLEKKQERWETYKKGMMQQIFSQKLRFKDENGEDYPDWEEKKLHEIAEICGGGTPSTEKKEYWNGSINWFTPSEVGKTKYMNSSSRKISESGLKKSSAKLLPPGTLLVTSRATIGEISILTANGTTNQGFQSLIIKKDHHNEFIYYLHNILKKEMIRRASGSTFLEISKNEVKNIQIQVACLVEQIKIANFLSSIDFKIEMIGKELEINRKFKKGLLQNMLC